MNQDNKLYIVCVDFIDLDYEFEFDSKEKALEAFSFFVGQKYQVQFYSVEVT